MINPRNFKEIHLKEKDEDAMQTHENREACGAWHEISRFSLCLSFFHEKPQMFLPEMLDLEGQL